MLLCDDHFETVAVLASHGELGLAPTQFGTEGEQFLRASCELGDLVTLLTRVRD